MSLPPRMNFLTAACRDVDRMADFLRAFGWPEAPSSEPVHRVIQLSHGVRIALYGAQVGDDGRLNRESAFGTSPSLGYSLSPDASYGPVLLLS